MFWRFLGDERGATAIEYGLIVALIALAIVGAVGTAGANLGEIWNNNAAEIVRWLNGGA